MKRTILSTIALLFLATNIFAAAWTGATSEPENMKKIDGKPFYVITNADELAWFAAKVNAGETTINAVLANDIVFGADTSSSSNIVWNEMAEYGGILDGNNYSIYGLFFRNDNDSKGGRFFVNKLSKNAVIKNLVIRKAVLQAGSGGRWGIVNINNGSLVSVHNFSDNRYSYRGSYIGGIVYENNGLIRKCSNNGYIIMVGGRETGTIGGIVGLNANAGIVDSCISNFGIAFVQSVGQFSGGVAGIAGINKGRIAYCINNVPMLITTYGKTYGIAYDNQGEILYCIQRYSAEGSISKDNTGTIKSSIDISTLSYYSNNKKIQLTEDAMKSDITAWKLNTLDGSEENSGVWTRGTDGYPTFANEDSLAIRKVVFDDDGTTSNRYTNYKGLVTFPENPEPAEGYVFSGWYNSDDIKVKPTTVFTADQTVNAVYVDASDVFWTINFYNAAPADTVLESKSYQHGSIVTYGGEAPTLASTAQYTYTFKGWNVEPTNAVEDFDYHAVYDSTVRSYAITFINTDSSKIESATFEYGKMPSCTKTPTREATVEWKYSHKGWKPALDFVTEDASYLAIYDSVKVKYKVTFMNGTSVIDTQSVAYGEAAVAPTNVNREGYKFVGWNTSFSKVTENLTVKALFEELVTYIVKVLDGDGTKIDSVKIVEGESYTLPTAPKKDGYTFDAYYNGKTMLGIAGDAIPVVANITITVVYTKDPESSSSSVVKSSSSSAKSSSSSIPKSSSSIKSSSSAKNSSSQVESSSSMETNIVYSMVKATPFSIHIQNRSIHISAAPLGSAYAIFDLQGRVLKKGRVESVNFNIPVTLAGNYVIKIGHITQHVQIK